MKFDYEMLVECAQTGVIDAWMESEAARNGTASLSPEMEEAFREAAKGALDAYLSDQTRTAVVAALQKVADRWWSDRTFGPGNLDGMIETLEDGGEL